MLGKLEHALETRARARHDSERQQREMYWAIVGKPSTQFEPARPGLLSLVANLADQVERHERWHEGQGDDLV